MSGGTARPALSLPPKPSISSCLGLACRSGEPFLSMMRFVSGVSSFQVWTPSCSTWDFDKSCPTFGLRPLWFLVTLVSLYCGTSSNHDMTLSRCGYLKKTFHFVAGVLTLDIPLILNFALSASIIYEQNAREGRKGRHTFFVKVPAAVSISSTSRSVNSPVFQPSHAVSQSLETVQICVVR